MNLNLIATTRACRKTALTIAVFFVAAFFASQAFAQTSWKGLSATWADSKNWTNGIPTASTDVIIGDANMTGNKMPTIQATSLFRSITVGGTKAASVSINAARTVLNITINSNGAITNNSALTIQGNFINNGSYTSNGKSSEEIFAGGTQSISGTFTNTFKKVTINANSVVTYSTNFTAPLNVYGTIIPDPAVNPTKAGITTIYAGGLLKVNAPLFATNYSTDPTCQDGGKIEYSGTVDQTIKSSITYKTLIISGTGIKKPDAAFSLSSTASTEGNVDVVSGTLDLGTFTMNRATGGTAGGSFIVEDSAFLKIGGTNTFPANYTTNTLESLSTVEYYGNNQVVANVVYGNLVLSGTSGSVTKTMASSALTIAGNFSSAKGTATLVSFTASAAMSVAGSITIGAGTTFTAGTFTHNVGGNFANNGTFTPSTGTIAFNGSVDQSILTSTTFNNITLNKASGKLNLSANDTVKGLTFTKGLLVTGTNKLVIPSGGTVTGASNATGWVYGNLQKYFTSAGGSFEIGGLLYYSPATVTFAAVNTPGYLIAAVTPSSHPNISSSDISSNNISRYWTISKPASGGVDYTTASLAFDWNANDNYALMNASALHVANYVSSAWNYPAVSGTPTTTHILVTGVSTLGDFAIGEYNPCKISSGFNYGGSTSFCSGMGSINVTLNSGATAGTFTASPVGLTLNATTGSINLNTSVAGVYTVTNTVISGYCTSSSNYTIQVVAAPSATISYGGSTICQSAGLTAVTRTGTSGGTYSSTAGLIINSSTGTINPSTSTLGTYTVTYTIPAANGCSVYTTTTVVTITAANTASFSYTGSPYCKNGGIATVSFSGTTGGTFSSTAGLVINATTGQVDLTSSTAGTYTVTYKIASMNGCAAFTTTASITINTAPATSISYSGTPYCSNGGFAYVTLTGTAGGSFTSTDGLELDDITGAVDLALSLPGTYTVTYTVSPVGGCMATATTSITVTAAPSASIAYAGNPFCKTLSNATVTLAGTAGGTFSAPAGLVINPITGEINIALSTAGTYTVTYSIAASGGCATFTTSTTVTITNAPSATITYGATSFCNKGTINVTLVGTTGGTFSSTTGLVINATTGAIDLASSTPGSYTIKYAIAASGGCTAFSTTTNITIGQSGLWTGAINNDWNNPGNWACYTVPTTGDNVVIPAGVSVYPTVMLNTGVVNNLTIATGASLTLSRATLKVSGSISASSSITVKDTSVVELTGTSSQVLPSGIFTNNTITALTVNNVAGVTLSGVLNITDLLSVKAGTINTGGYLTLKSTETNTARVGVITSAAATPIVGNVTVERYIPGKRKYRLMTSSVTTSSKSTLAAGEEAQSIWGNWQNSGSNATANTGVYITGGSSVQGFDTQTSSASLYTYNSSTKAFVGYTSANGKNTKYTPLKAGEAYYMFVYGDRQNSLTTPNPNSTVLKATGTLLTGDQTYTSSSSIPLASDSGKFALIGNPYACTIDWKLVQKSKVSNTIWGWDPNLSTSGGYVTVTATSTGEIISPLSSLVKVSRYIQPGQGFFIKTTGTSPLVLITEQTKVEDVYKINNQVFRTTTPDVQPLIAANLLYDNAGSKVLLDGVVAAFEDNFSNGLDDVDAPKMSIPNDGLSLKDNNLSLSIDARQMPSKDDTLALNFSKLTKQQYTLQIFAQQLSTGNLMPYIEDNYLHTALPLSLTDTNNILFNVVSSDPASSATNRFNITFRELSSLPVTFTSVSATAKNNDVEVDWSVAAENGIRSYQVQRSNDGIAFSTIAEVAPKQNNVEGRYSLLDKNVTKGNDYYRIIAIEADGSKIYSKTVLLKLFTTKPAITVYPNPVKNKIIHIQLNNTDDSVFNVLLINAKGQVVLSKEINTNSASEEYKLSLNNNLSSGMYYINISGKNTTYSERVIIE